VTFERIRDNLFIGLTLAGLEMEGFKLLEKLNSDDIYLLIESDKPWVLSEELLKWAKPAYKRFYQALETYTPEYILGKLRNKRPELYSVIVTHPRGGQWLETRLTELRQQLEP
jgi:hypothetical protein